jgi:hypothetical protein
MQSYPKVGFNLLGDIYKENNIISFIQDKLINKLIPLKTSQIFNYYNQYLGYKTIIAVCSMDYIIYLINNDSTGKTYQHSSFRKHAIKLLDQTARELPAYIENNNSFEMEKCILASINVIYSCFTYLEMTISELTSQSDIDIIGNN